MIDFVLDNLKPAIYLLVKILQTHNDGSFSRMACDYIHATGMTLQEVKELLEAMRQAMTKNK